MIETLRGQHILIDSCIIIQILTGEGSEELMTLLHSLESRENLLCINDVVKLEIIRGAKGAKELSRFNSLLGNFDLLPISRKTIDRATEIYPLYNYCSKSIRNKGQVSAIDALNAAQISEYSIPIYLLTFDLYDYPTEFISREEVGVVDAESVILTWGIFKFDLLKFKALKNRFESN